MQQAAGTLIIYTAPRAPATSLTERRKHLINFPRVVLHVFALKISRWQQHQLAPWTTSIRCLTNIILTHNAKRASLMTCEAVLGWAFLICPTSSGEDAMLTCLLRPFHVKHDGSTVSKFPPIRSFSHEGKRQLRSLKPQPFKLLSVADFLKHASDSLRVRPTFRPQPPSTIPSL